MKIWPVRSKAYLSDTTPIFLAIRLTWIFRLKTLKPSALTVGIENFAADQRTHPGHQIVSGRA